jgi:hypothetical protein
MTFRKAEIVLLLSSRPLWRVRDAEGEKQASIIRPMNEIGEFLFESAVTH